MNSFNLYNLENERYSHQKKNDSSVTVDEIKIWEDFKLGSETALVYIYRTYADILFKYGQQFCKDKELLKDSLQELFLDLIKNRENLSNTSSIKFYLFKSFRRKIAKKANRNLNLHLDIDEHIDSIVVKMDPETIFIEDQMNQQKQDLLKKAIEELNPIQKEAICLYFFEGFSYAKIAEIFDYSNVKSVRNMIYRAIEDMTIFIKKSGIVLELILLGTLSIFK